MRHLVVAVEYSSIVRVPKEDWRRGVRILACTPLFFFFSRIGRTRFVRGVAAVCDSRVERKFVSRGRLFTCFVKESFSRAGGSGRRPFAASHRRGRGGTTGEGEC